MLDANPHPELSFALDVADKAIKLAAVLLGGVWTYWNYRKSRTYESKLDLQLTAVVFARGELYVEIIATIRNVGASRMFWNLMAHSAPFSPFSTIFRKYRYRSFQPLYRIINWNRVSQPTMPTLAHPGSSAQHRLA